VEWAQWLSGTYTNKNYDLTIISHVEPFDLGNFAKPDYYWGYQSQQFNELFDKIKNTPRPADRARLLRRSACWPRTRARLPVPAAVGHRGQQEAARAVEGHADLRQRSGRTVLGLIS
jgi:hypothetical protein